MAQILKDISRTFNEFLLIPNLTDERCIPSNVSLRTPLVKYKKGEEPTISLNCSFKFSISLFSCRKFSLNLLFI